MVERSSSLGELIERIAAENPTLRAFRRLASDVDRQLQVSWTPHADADRPLHNIPCAVKENIDVAGWPTQAGLGALPQPATTDARCIARLRQAGAVVIGHTAMDEAALGGTTDNPHYGKTHNPLRHGFTPGGSSGGSAAAVGAGLVSFAIGTDTLGSVRIPAAYCGIFGFKPSVGRISTGGVRLLAPSLDHVGVLADSIATITAVFHVMAESPTVEPDSPIRSDLGLPDLPYPAITSPEIAERLQFAVDRLRDRGISIRKLDPAGWQLEDTARAAFLCVEVEAAQVYKMDLERPDWPASQQLRRLLEFGRTCPPARYDGARRTIAQARETVVRWLDQAPVVLLPTCPQVAFPFDSPGPTNQAHFTVLANIAGLPAVSIPLPPKAKGDLPGALQLIGRQGRDEALLHAAARVADMLH